MRRKASTEHLASIAERLREAQRGRTLSDVSKSQIAAYGRRVGSAGVAAGAKALSVSCGDGMFDYLTFSNNSNIASITAIDIVDCPVQQNDISLLKKKGLWDFQRVQAEAPLPFRSESFDLVFHHDVIEHVHKPYRFLKEQFRVLKNGGYLIFGTPNLLRPVNLIKALTGQLRFPVVIGGNEEIGQYIHVQEYTQWSMLAMLEETGFTDREIDYCYFGLHMLNLTFAKFPANDLGRTLCHYLLFTAQKKAGSGNGM